MYNFTVKKRQKTIKKMNNSGKVQCEICGEKTFLEQHHIRGRNIPNAEHPSNKCNICANCHSKVHWGDIILEGWVMTTSGLELFWHYKNEESFTGNDAIPHIIGKN